MPDNDMHIASELLRRTSNPQLSLDTSRGWVAEHQKEYANLRLSWGVQPSCPDTVASPWVATLTPAQRSGLTWMQYKLIMSQPKPKRTHTASGQVAPKRKCPALLVNLAPSIARMSASQHYDGCEISACILPTQTLWVHHPTMERIVLGREALMFQGWPVALLPDDNLMTNKLMEDLAGNGVSLPVLFALILSTCCAIEWQTEDEAETVAASTTEDVEEALKLLEGFTHST